jgi:tetratricopeptide (TPR) repeat protein
MSRGKDSGKGRRETTLARLDTRLKVIGLIILVVEAGMLGSLFMLPPEQRLYVFIAAAMILLVGLVGLIWLESRVRDSPSTAPQESALPPELQGTAIYVVPDPPGHGAGAAMSKRVDAEYRTATVHKFAGRYDDAIQAYNRILVAVPKHLKSRYNIASCNLYAAKRDTSRATIAISQFRALANDLEGDPESRKDPLCEFLHGAYIQINKSLDLLGRWDDCIVALVQSLAAKPDDPLSYLNLALVHAKKGDREAAAEYYKAMIEHPDGMRHLATATSADRDLLKQLEGGM